MLRAVAGLADAAWAAFWPCLRLGGAILSWWVAVSVGLRVSSHLPTVPLAEFPLRENALEDAEWRMTRIWTDRPTQDVPPNISGWTLVESLIAPPGGSWYTYAAEKVIVLLGGWAVARLRR